MNHKAISDLQWTIAFIVVILILAGGWLAFVTRAGSGAEVAQDYMVRNLAYLSTTMLSKASIVSYCFNTNSDIDFQINYNEKTVDVASKINTGNLSSFPSPSKYLHPFPIGNELDSNKYINNFCMISFGDKFRVSKNVDVGECDVYSQYKYPKTKSDTNLLILSSSNETLQKINSVVPALGIKTEVALLDNIDNYKNQFDFVIIIEENEIDNQKILLGTPLKYSKKLGCSLNEEFEIEVIQKNLGIDINSETIVLILVNDLEEQRLISSISNFLG